MGADHRSQLAVELAKRFDGEIINGDAMQLYAGLPIITNKITLAEQEGIPHHLLGCVGLHEQPWVVGTFVTRAMKVIQEIRGRGRLPILVGGTHYYTQSLLFRDRLAEVKEDAEPSQLEDSAVFPILQEPTSVLLEELTRVDPVMAERWHPNDRRKIQRSLEIYLKTGRKASDIYSDQREQKQDAEFSDSDTTSSMRQPTLLFWVHADTESLRARLDHRVDKMVCAGLLVEVSSLQAFAAEQERCGRPVDESRGIWVSIGYKEYKPYLRALECADADATIFEAEGLERTKISTRQYAKRQVQWIRIKLVNALVRAGIADNLYLLDGSDLSSFGRSVVEPAIDLTLRFLRGDPRPQPAELSEVAVELLTPKRNDVSHAPDQWIKQYCAFCDVTCVTQAQWATHTKSKSHRRILSKHKQSERESGSIKVVPG